MGAYYPLLFSTTMQGLDLYREIGVWINRYHNRRWRSTGLLNDFIHDLWLKLIEDREETTLSFIKKHCWLYPQNAVRYKYYKKNKDFSSREIILLDENLQPQMEFPDDSFNPEYEFPTPPAKKLKRHKDTKRIKVSYRNETEEEFDSATELAKHLGVHRNNVYGKIGKDLPLRFTKKKMSHIKTINYA